MKAFPHWGVGARGLPAPGQAGLDAWAKENGAPAGTLTIDFMLRSRYDFNHYKGIAAWNRTVSSSTTPTCCTP